jgi:hypothetical protein
MQSILQYKSFGQHVSYQYQRRNQKNETLDRGNAGRGESHGGESSANRDPSIDARSLQFSPDSSDPEKAEQPGSGNSSREAVETEQPGSDDSSEGVEAEQPGRYDSSDRAIERAATVKTNRSLVHEWAMH